MAIAALDDRLVSMSDAVTDQPIGLTRRIGREQFVFIFDEDRREPVFHRWAPVLTHDMPDGDREPGLFTGCGRRLSSWQSFTKHYHARLRPEHAMTFARPCRRCWKDNI